MVDLTSAQHNMKTYGSTMKRGRLAVLVCLLGLFQQVGAQILNACAADPTNRPPQNSDINVTCGSQFMDLSIYLCPVYNSQYNESQMVLNNQINNSLCYGTADLTVSPPVLKFRFPLIDSSLSSCGNIYQIADKVGSGQWADFSSIQTVNISGTVTGIDSSVGMITYRQQILYKFSCAYPLQYLLNNTQISASGATVAIRDNNASFITALTMQLYKDRLYQEVLTIPSTGLKIKTKIYVEIKATNLTEKFNLLLDRCYATASPLSMQNTYYDLFMGCTHDPQTVVEVNGVSQAAHFNFEAFRFVDHQNLTSSTFYLHCTTRLCDAAKCSSIMAKCNTVAGRRKRAAEDVSTTATITSPPIHVTDVTVQDDGDDQDADLQEGILKPDTGTSTTSQGPVPHLTYSRPMVAIIVCIAILTVSVVALAAYFVMYVKQRKQQQLV